MSDWRERATSAVMGQVEDFDRYHPWITEHLRQREEKRREQSRRD